MAGLREIQNRKKSIQDTRKITGAMYMISSTKMKKAKRDLEKTEPYFFSLQDMMDQVMLHMPEAGSIFLDNPDRERTRIGLLVVTGDKGLAGAYNHNVLKLAQTYLDNPKLQVSLFVVGELGRSYFAGRHLPIEEDFLYTAQNPGIGRARWITERLLTPYREGRLDELHVIYTRMENSLVSLVEDKMLLPLPHPKRTKEDPFFFQTSAEEALGLLVPNYLSGFVYGALVEAFCSEQHDRMMAMEAATNNADELLRELGILYNRARQAAITQQITEVSGGARAQKRKRRTAGTVQRKQADKKQGAYQDQPGGKRGVQIE